MAFDRPIEPKIVVFSSVPALSKSKLEESDGF